MPTEKEGKSKKTKEKEQKKETLGFFDEDVAYSKSSEANNRSLPKIDNAGEIRNVLKKLWADKLKAEQETVAAQSEETFQPLQQLLKDDIATVRKDDVFASEVTKEEQDIIRQRVDQQRKALQEYERRMRSGKIKKIHQVHPYVTEEEAIQTLIECNEDEEESIVFLTDWFNLQSIRKTIAKKHEKANPAPEVPAMANKSSNSDDEDEEEKLAFIRRRKKKTPMKQKSKNGKEYTYRKLRLDDAIAQGNFEGWSEARIRAWNQRDKNPNAYYYRFNAPGEKQRNGKWTKDEISLFYKRMKEVGVNGQWGIFSMTIPGRVGYQCSNFYRQLIETSQIKDENYVLDEKGKAHYVFKKGQRKSKASGSPSQDGESEGKTRKRVTTRKRKKRSKKDDDDDEDEMEDDDDEYRPFKASKKVDEEDVSSHETKEEDNPLPGFVDPVTLCEVERPAISPYGHVMGYESWVRWLNQEQHRNVCPWTKKTVKKRDLVILTWENIDQYKDKIANWNKEGEKNSNNTLPM